jgi:hypothetical protein
MSKIRTLIFEGLDYKVDAYGCMIGEHKFGHLPLHAIRDYDTSIIASDCFGDVSEWGSYWWKVPKVYHHSHTPDAYQYYYETSDGFVYEVSAKEWDAEWDAYCNAANEQEERDNAILDAQQTIEELEEEEKGPCDSCNKSFVSFGGMSAVIHEQGCPREHALKDARTHLERLEDY